MGSGCKMWKTPRGDLKRGPHMTFDIESPSLVTYHGITGPPNVKWPLQCQVGAGSRVRMSGGGARGDEGCSRQGKIQRFRRRKWSSSPWGRGQVYVGRDRESSRRDFGITVDMASGTRSGRIPMFRAGRHQGFATRVTGHGSKQMGTGDWSTHMYEGKGR